jgi:hypothetical protein
MLFIIVFWTWDDAEAESESGHNLVKLFDPAIKTPH